MTCRLEFKVNDCWVGAFWRVGPPARLWALEGECGGPGDAPRRRRVDLWICLLPMLPIHFTWFREATALPSEGSLR